MNLNAIEIASRKAWPALQEAELPFGVLRFAHGVSRRTNCLSLFIGARPDWSLLCSLTETFFERFEQPAIIRLLGVPSANETAELDRFLETSGYRLVTPTRVMVCNIGPGTQAELAALSNQAIAVKLDAWLSAWHQLIGKSAHEHAIHHLMLQRLPRNHLLLVHYDSNGQPVSTGMSVCDDQLMGVFGIATALSHRNKGFARNLVQQLMNWGSSEGAATAYLQVEEANTAASSVYESLGFREAYRYWYREKQFGDHEKGGIL